MKGNQVKRPLVYWLLLFLLFFQGVSATPAGLMLVSDPTGETMQMPVTWLAGTIFPNYLIPGLILTIVLGLGAFFVLASLLFLPERGRVRRRTDDLDRRAGADDRSWRMAAAFLLWRGTGDPAADACAAGASISARVRRG